MTNRTVEMYALSVPLTAIKKLSDEQRFAYYLLGHIFNELMCLQKLVGFALPKHDDRRPARLRPELGQAMFLFRLASGKSGKQVKQFGKPRNSQKRFVKMYCPSCLTAMKG
ncbi:MAG: hypothetical protein ABI564_08680 [Ideonella sp.]